MAKIRSTLDIVMERTKDLSLSAEEKEKFRREEWKGKCLGLVQRYRARLLDTDALRIELAQGKQDYPGLEKIFRQELIRAINPDQEQQLLAEGLKDVLGIDPAPYLARMEAYQGRRTELWRQASKKALSDLKRRGVQGSAVLPNLENDPGWKATLEMLHAELQEELIKL